MSAKRFARLSVRFSSLLRLGLALAVAAVVLGGLPPAPARADSALPPIAAGTNPYAVAVNPVTNKVYVAAPADLPAAHLLNPDGTLNLASGYDGVLDLRGWQVRLDAQHGPVFQPAQSLPASLTVLNLTRLAAHSPATLGGLVLVLVIAGGLVIGKKRLASR
jgi:hypothetical protein